MTTMMQRGAIPASFAVNTANAWKFILPPVYRYLPSQFVDAFFETGALRLSTFKQFSAHQDEARKDGNEGISFLSLNNAEHTFFTVSTRGNDVFVLCGSTILSGAIRQQFSGSQCAIEITNVPSFGLAVARQLVGFKMGMSGHCIYGGRGITRTVDTEIIHASKQPGSEISLEAMEAAAHQAAQDEDLFLKDARYSTQSEYRLLWAVDQIQGNYIDIVCPEAREFCRKVTPEEIDEYVAVI